MASPKQVAANRSNALLSTGPMSDEGRRRAAVNALRHGLSRQAVSPEDAQAMEAVACLIQDECAGTAAAQELASKILDYERNEARQREYLVSVLQPTKAPLTGQALEQAVRDEFPEYAMLQEMMAHDLQARAGINGQELTKVSRLLLGMRNLVELERQEQAVKLHRDWQGSVRYLKRASNQLVKSLRAVAAQ